MSHRMLPTVTPGEVLQEEFLKPLKLSQYELAKRISVPPRRINEIVKGIRAVTADTAIRLGRYFDMSERFWLNLQMQHDVEARKRDLGARLEDEVQPRSVYHPPGVGMRDDKIVVRMADGKWVTVNPRTKRKYGAALMERMSQYYVAQGSSLPEVRQKALKASLRGRPKGFYLEMKNGKMLQITPRAIRKYGRPLMERFIRSFEAQTGMSFLEYLEKVRAWGATNRGTGG